MNEPTREPDAPPAGDETPLAADDLALLERARDACARLQREIGGVVFGQDAVVRALLASIFADGHVLLVGVPGLAKTLLVKTLAQAFGWQWRRIQFTPDLMPADIVGMELLQEEPGGGRQLRFVPGPVFTNLLLADEINRTPPKTQSALLEAMQERHVTSMGRTHPIEPPFVVVATQNPVEQEGTYPLPEAQLDRFMFSLRMDYPARADEERVVAETTAARTVSVAPVCAREDMLAFQGLVRRLPAGRHTVSAAVHLACVTRPSDPEAGETARRYVEWGAGTRAAQYLVLGAKALAAIDGEPAANIRHVREIAPHVLRHRVIPNYQAAGDGIDAAELVRRFLRETDPSAPAPARPPPIPPARRRVP